MLLAMLLKSQISLSDYARQTPLLKNELTLVFELFDLKTRNMTISLPLLLERNKMYCTRYSHVA